MTVRATHAILLDIAQAGDRLVAVGEHGIILLSDNFGKTWRQVPVPISVTLTAVQFASPKVGWAVGHAGIVLSTNDGGETWTCRLDGKTAAELVLKAAEAQDSAAAPVHDNRAGATTNPDTDNVLKPLADAQRLVADGWDKPFLALHFDNEKSGYVVGAYNLIFRTEDGGVTWQPWLSHVDNPKGAHLYAITRCGGILYIAGEQGTFLRSKDDGQHFENLATPYKGSYFAMATLPSCEIVIVGLRGNAYRSSDQGATWSKIDFRAPISFTSAGALDDHSFFLTNQAGQIFVSRDRGQTWQVLASPPLPPITGAVEFSSGGFVGVSMGGVWQFGPSLSARQGENSENSKRKL